MTLAIPRPSLVVLIGPSGAGKSTFARKHFKPTEIVSSDFCRGLVSDDEGDQSATESAFELLRFIAAKRLKASRLTVIDATSVQPDARRPLLALAREFNVPAVAIVFHLPEELCVERSLSRPDRSVPVEVVRKQARDLRESLSDIEREGFRPIYVLTSSKEIDSSVISTY